jgi:hypothetical protein
MTIASIIQVWGIERNIEGILIWEYEKVKDMIHQERGKHKLALEKSEISRHSPHSRFSVSQKLSLNVIHQGMYKIPWSQGQVS